ncbi:hypothetical protein SAMN04488073_1106 [Marinobacter gudaonensis]|jgi:hypothetical protein|uniref:DUF6316 domain-containing protein n=1 Tax=Marinobacter gudaonensis TaxID=375760 RepID=A0A1I6GLY0_9GAMM|nr:DUF6316 family protein [Marinobacter gudaonensis]SFR43129.1 hypothetical protein SAMN04488073_1106 [Marinobacter gudaonensis]
MRAETRAVAKQQEGRLVRTVLGWYVKTREQMDLGPFASRQEAAHALQRHIRLYRGLNPRTGPATARMHIHDAETCQRSNCCDCLEAKELGLSMAVAS